MKREAAVATCALVNNKNNNRPDVGWDELGKCFEADYNFIAPHQSSGGCNKYQQLKHSFSRLLREKLFYWKFRSDQHHLINLQINGWLEVGVLFNSNHFLFLKKIPSIPPIVYRPQLYFPNRHKRNYRIRYNVYSVLFTKSKYPN